MKVWHKKGQFRKSEPVASVHWRAPEFHVHNAKFYASVAFGPRVSLDISVPGTKGHVALAMNARFDIPKFEFNAGQAQSAFIILS
jgi:hypothetical protein